MRFAGVILTLGLSLLAETGTADSNNGVGDFMKLHTSYTVNDQPILGTYTAWTIEDFKLVKEVGMNVVIGDREMLDPENPRGKFLLENGIKVMYHFTHHIYGMPRLGDFITPDQTTIPLSKVKSRELPGPGVIQIEDELIRYQKYTPEALLGCERGFDGTQPAAHYEGMFLFMPEECIEDIESVKDSPNLWGYYVLDDSHGDAISALRAMYRIVQRVDGPNRHPVCAGYGSPGSLCNFGPGVCDIMMIYWYPVSDSSYDRYMISREVQWMLTTARARVPGVPFVGVYQAFWGGGAAEPTPQQVREQMEDFVREGACGLIALGCRVGGSYGGWSDSRKVQGAMKEVHEEMLSTGGLEVSPQPDEMVRDRIQPVGFWERPDKIPGLVPAWYVIGPFDDPEHKILEAIYPPEYEIDLDAGYEGKPGPVHWIKRASNSGGVIGLYEIYGLQDYTTNTAAYATCTVTNPREREVEMRIGRDDDIVVWMNSKEVWRHGGVRGLERDDDIVPVVLPAGDTQILVKVYNRGGMWAFSMRFTDRKGQPLKGLKFSPSDSVR